MKPFAATLCMAGMFAVLAGCRFDRNGDGVTQSLGRDHIGLGGSVSLTSEVDGDAFLAGGDVATASEVRGSLFAAGGQVSVGGNVARDLYAGGGDVRVDAIVAGNARMAGGNVTVGPATVVSGATHIAAGDIRFEGDARGDLDVSGGTVSIDGRVQGDADVDAGELEIGPQTNIAGKLIVHSPSKPVVPEGARIGGGLEFHLTHVDHDAPSHEVHEFAPGLGSVFWLAGVFAAGALFTFAFPGYSTRAADWIGREPLRSLGLGFVVLCCLPILFVLLLVTIIGIPLAFIVAGLYVLLLFLGWITAALFLARKGLQQFRRDRPATAGVQMGALAAAIVALWLVGHLPLVGGWIRFAALVFGIGALVWQGWPRRRPTTPVAA
jgi:hypothetical protein